MKSVKKMLSLLLVAMLLVAAIPFAASADVYGPGDSFTVLFAAQKGSEAGFSTPLALVTDIPADSDDFKVVDLARAALSQNGIALTKDNIVAKVTSNGYANLLNDVVYGDIVPVVDPAQKQVRFVLIVTARPGVSTEPATTEAKIWIDKENTGTFEDTGLTTTVSLIKTTVGGGEPTYSLKPGAGASVNDIRGLLGASYKSKTLSMRMTGPTGSSKTVDYWVTVLGDSGNTGTNVPVINGAPGDSNNGVISGPSNGNSNIGNGTNTGSNNNNGTIGSGGSAGNGTNGSNNGTTGGTNGTTGTVNTPNYSEVPGNVYLEIYTNKNFGSYDARFSITNNSNKNYNIGTDGTVSAERGGDLWNLMASIYTAKDSNGMEVKLYQFEGNNFPVDWAFGNYYTSISNLTAARQNKDITIRVVVNNVYRKTADTSNPKTGDPIMMSVAVLGITACGLAAAFIYSKKRKAV